MSLDAAQGQSQMIRCCRGPDTFAILLRQQIGLVADRQGRVFAWPQVAVIAMYGYS